MCQIATGPGWLGAFIAAGLYAAVGVGPAAAQNDSIPGTNWTSRDWEILSAKVIWADSARLDTLPLGSAIARLGATFVGTKYTPGTLEVPGPERIVINLRELDCVTFVENVLAMTRFIRHDGSALLNDPALARTRYESYLRDLRYRNGVLAGYPSRLHYFTEWLADNERRGQIRQVTRGLGGVRDTERITFMTSHRSAYRQLVDPAVYQAIRKREARLNDRPGRWFLPKNRIGGAADRIHDGDLIAATSTLQGLDVAHTGLAIWVDGSLHLLHAPLVGKAVEISPLPLAERILGIRSQDGIIVARPVSTLPGPRRGSAPERPAGRGPSRGTEFPGSSNPVAALP